MFSKPFQVGIELNYADGNTVAIRSSADGESTTSTSWIQDQAGMWQPYSIAFGANIAMNIQPMIGMKPSVQVSASKLLVSAGEEVVLNGRGASIFVWNAADGTIKNYAGPQLIAHPFVTTTYTTNGSGLELCNKSATTTIYVRDEVTAVKTDSFAAGVSIFPNPGTNELNLIIDNYLQGSVSIQIMSVFGSEVVEPVTLYKSDSRISTSFNTTDLTAGIYLVAVKQAGQTVIKKWVKY